MDRGKRKGTAKERIERKEKGNEGKEKGSEKGKGKSNSGKGGGRLVE